MDKVTKWTKWVKNLSVKTQLNFLTGAFIATFCILGLGTFLAMFSLQYSASKTSVNGPMYKRIVQGKDILADVLPPPEYLLETYLVAMQLLNSNDDKEEKELVQKYGQLKKDFSDRHKFWVDDLKENAINEDAAFKDVFLKDSYEPAIALFNTMDSEYLPAIKSGRKNLAKAILMGDIKRKYLAHRAGIDKVVALATERNTVDEENVKKFISRSNGLVVAILLALIAFAAVMLTSLIYLGRIISRSLSDSLEGISVILQENSEQVGNAAQQSASASSQLSHAATEQAASLEETSSAIEEINSMIKRNADNAHKAAEVSDATQGSARKGQEVVGEMLKAINDISESNKQISEIVKVISEIENKTKVINDIVFKTQLLSFNASVEAARAGTHGRGFSVVAEEVGKLAQLSGNAAGEISSTLAVSVQKVLDLITTAKDKVNVGLDVAQQCGTVLDDIVRHVATLTQMSKEIASATHEQSIGVEEVAKAVVELDLVTQGNATASEKCASAAENLSTQSEALKGVVLNLVKTVQGSPSQDMGAKKNSLSGKSELAVDAENNPAKIVHFKSAMSRKAYEERSKQGRSAREQNQRADFKNTSEFDHRFKNG